MTKLLIVASLRNGPIGIPEFFKKAMIRLFSRKAFIEVYLPLHQGSQTPFFMPR